MAREKDIAALNALVHQLRGAFTALMNIHEASEKTMRAAVAEVALVQPKIIALVELLDPQKAEDIRNIFVRLYAAVSRKNRKEVTVACEALLVECGALAYEEEKRGGFTIRTPPHLRTF